LRDEVVRDIVAFLRIILDPDDNLALRICLQTGYARGIGDQAISKLRMVAERTSRSLWQIARESHTFSELRRWRLHFERFVQSAEKIISAAQRLDAVDAVELVARSLGTRSRVSAQRLQKLAARFSGEDGLSEFVDELHKNRTLDLAGGTAEPTEEDQDAVSIMSMHASKGLTYDVVFILGMENGNMPSLNQDIDEQRRLLYVAMTRARNELYLCASRRRSGPPARGFRFYNPSGFLREIPTDLTVQIDNTHG
jgi:superfamily I DNA/RNA helicase